MMEGAKERVISLPSDMEASDGVTVVTVASLWEKGMKMSRLQLELINPSDDHRVIRPGNECRLKKQTFVDVLFVQ